MIRRLFCLYTLCVVGVLCLSGSVYAKTVTLSWDPSPTLSVVGYKVLTSLSQLMTTSTVQDVGDVLSYTVKELENTDSHWFCVKAYDILGNESTCSNIVNSPPIENTLPELDFEVDVELLNGS